MGQISQIKIGFTVAYDWNLLEISLPLVYDNADVICLSIDKDRISWVGNKFKFDEDGFKELVQRIDVDNKIIIYEDDFHRADLKPMENEVRQRNLMADKMGKDGWHLQLDTDEYFLNFRGFVDYVKHLNPKRNINVACPLITLYKKTETGYLAVNPLNIDKIEFIAIASINPKYQYGRRNGYFNINVPFFVLHQSWARTDEEVWTKLSNWGHRFDSDIDKYFALWQNASESNYKTYKNFNQTIPAAWPELILLKTDKGVENIAIDDLGINLNSIKNKLWFLRENSIWVSRLNKMINKLKK